ncbi:MAG: glycosyltransferase [Leptolyngbyaceae cyanobacterium bins.349]|nr:glycosyltransferase [Leptolyngbyaceae cyanobacterium bins.349]
MLDVCICTHNPQRELLNVVVTAIARQTLGKEKYQVWVIDNCSNPQLTSADFAPLDAAGVIYKILWEPRLGLSYARWCAIEATQNEVIVFVDDDNELVDDYLEKVVEIIENHPEIGCFGGKLLLPPETVCPAWMHPLLPYLGIRDFGNEAISSSTNHWGEWEPAGAGVVVRRPVLNLYLKRLQALPTSASLGRKGRKGLFSSEDSLMVRGAYEFGLQCSYQPQLMLKHHLQPNRFKFGYLFKLMYFYGRSYVILERSLGNNPPVLGVRGAIQSIIERAKIRTCDNFWHSLCLIAWDVGYFQELRFGQ